MIAVIQRIFRANIIADKVDKGTVGKGLYILLGVENEDTEKDCLLLADKIAKLRIFNDKNDKMNLSIHDIDGEVAIVSNFTLNANYAHGNRPDYLAAAKPDLAKPLYEHFVSLMKERVSHVITGTFGADMQSVIETDGPVTIIMHSGILGGNHFNS